MIAMLLPLTLMILFFNSVQQLSQTFPAIDPSQPVTCEGPVSDLSTINEAKVDTILSNLSNSKAKDIHCLDTAFLKLHKESVISPVTTIINKSINEGIFPSSFKTAIVTP